MNKVFLLHENEDWVAPLRRALSRRDQAFEEWFLDDGWVDPRSVPPQGVFYSRMSASSHMRGHPHAPELTALVLAWLEDHRRRVVNGSRALRLEISKAAQHEALAAAGIPTPRTVVAVGRRGLVEAARALAPGPLIVKPNRGGKGDGVRLFETVEGLADYARGEAYEPTVDGVSLVQEYIHAPQPFIIRAEFIGGRFFYAVRVDTSGGFELCPADACSLGDTFCPVGGEPGQRFTIIDTIDSTLAERYERFLADNGIEVAGVEFITDRQGRVFTYDININTNYNADAEARAGLSAMDELARFLAAEAARTPADRDAPLSLAG